MMSWILNPFCMNSEWVETWVLRICTLAWLMVLSDMRLVSCWCNLTWMHCVTWILSAFWHQFRVLPDTASQYTMTRALGAICHGFPVHYSKDPDCTMMLLLSSFCNSDASQQELWMHFESILTWILVHNYMDLFQYALYGDLAMQSNDYLSKHGSFVEHVSSHVVVNPWILNFFMLSMWTTWFQCFAYAFCMFFHMFFYAC